MHTVLTQDLIEISLQSNENLDALLDLIKDKAQDEKSLRSHVFALLCELAWINNSILLLLRRDFQDFVFKGKDQKEVILSKVTLDSLSTLLLARWQATSELNKFSYSLSLH
jgi:hypothetical protein